MQCRNLTIMFTDLKGYTERTSRVSREKMRSLMQTHEELILPIIRGFQGNVIKNIGDAFLVTFESPTNAVLCGLVIQDSLKKFNEKIEDEDDKIEVRVAINSGEVEIREGDVFGEPVNIAARIEGITEANEVFFTEAVYLSMNKQEVPSSEIGMRRLKGIPEPIKIYRVIQDEKEKSYQEAVKKGDFIGIQSISKNEVVSEPQAKKKNRKIWILIIIFVMIPIYRKISSHLDRSRMRNERITRRYGDKIQIKDGKLNIRAENNSLINTLKLLASSGKINLIIKEDIQTKFSGNFEVESPMRGIELLCKIHDLDLIFTNEVYLVSKKTVTVQPPVTTIIPEVKEVPFIKELPETKIITEEVTDDIEEESQDNGVSEATGEVNFQELLEKTKLRKAIQEYNLSLLKDPAIAKRIKKLKLSLNKQDIRILIHLSTSLFKYGEKFYQDADKSAKLFLSKWTGDPDANRMEDILIGSLEKHKDKIESLEDAFESVKYTTYSRTKWSKVWGNMTDNKLGGERFYWVMDSRDKVKKTVYDFMNEEYQKTLELRKKLLGK